jgi:hypothetical protein
MRRQGVEPGEVMAVNHTGPTASRANRFETVRKTGGWIDPMTHPGVVKVGEGTTAVAGTPFSVQLCGS